MQLPQNFILVSISVDGLNVEVVYGQATSLGMDSRPVDSGAGEAERRSSATASERDEEGTQGNQRRAE